MTALERAIADPPHVGGVAVDSPVSGLARRSLGFLDVLAQSVSAAAPSAAATTIPAIVFAAAGGGTVLAVAGALLLSLLVATTINQFTRRMSATGSLYTFVSKGLGAGASFFTGVSMLIGYGFITMFALAGSGLFLATLLGHFVPGAAASTELVSILIVVFAAACFLVLARGIRISTRVTLLIESISVALVVVLVIALLVRQGGGIHWSALSVKGVNPGQFATGVVLALTAFVGFESASTLGVEAKRPFAAVPRAIVWTVIVSGVLYLLASYSELVGFSAIGGGLGDTTSPVNVLTNAYGLPWMGLVLDASIATSFFACAVASTTALVRVLFSMAREGLIPEGFGQTHPRFRTPLIAVATVIPILVIIPLLAIAAGGDVWTAMGVVLVSAAAGYITSYVMVCIAAFVFLTRIGELTFWVGLRALAAGILLAVSLVIYLVAQASGAGALGVVLFLAAMAGGGVVYLWLSHNRPWFRERIGIYDETTAVDVLGGPDGG